MINGLIDVRVIDFATANKTTKAINKKELIISRGILEISLGFTKNKTPKLKEIIY